MVTTEEKCKMKLSLSIYEKANLEVIVREVSQQLGFQVNMTWVLKTLIELAINYRAADCYPQPPTYNAGEKALLSRMAGAFIASGVATTSLKE